MFASFACIFAILGVSYGQLQPVQGTKCSPNQVVTKLTVYDDGAIEAECNKLPCGVSAIHCNDNQTICRAETDTFSGMKWATNGQSVLLLCCALTVPRKIYVGTDLVSLGSYYTGGMVDKKDLYGKDGTEFDFVSNIRTEQGGVRVWVYRVICPKSPVQTEHVNEHPPTSDRSGSAHERRRPYFANTSTAKKFIDFREAAANTVEVDPEAVQRRVAPPRVPQNPLQYRPTNYRRDSLSGYKSPPERLL